MILCGTNKSTCICLYVSSEEETPLHLYSFCGGGAEEELSELQRDVDTLCVLCTHHFHLLINLLILGREKYKQTLKAAAGSHTFRMYLCM